MKLSVGIFNSATRLWWTLPVGACRSALSGQNAGWLCDLQPVLGCGLCNHCSTGHLCRHSRVSGVILPSSYRVIVVFVVLASTVNTVVRECKCVCELALSLLPLQLTQAAGRAGKEG